MSGPAPRREPTALLLREGLAFVLPPALLAALLAGLQLYVPAAAAGVLAVFFAGFFRNPQRRAPEVPRAILSGADGRVMGIAEVEEPRFLKGRAARVSVFMSVVDVHVNRAPVAGAVLEVVHTPGRFVPALRAESAAVNEQNALLLETRQGHRVLMVQVAGILARRIACWVGPGDRVARGQRVGVIRFGSRLDLYLPPESRVVVRVGEHVRGGESIVGYLP